VIVPKRWPGLYDWRELDNRDILDSISIDELEAAIRAVVSNAELWNAFIECFRTGSFGELHEIYRPILKEINPRISEVQQSSILYCLAAELRSQRLENIQRFDVDQLKKIYGTADIADIYTEEELGVRSK
jgi:protein tyrosine phosphatase